ncbi:PKD domain-containing protein [Maribacter sp. 2307ULW6-5]|uniref:PKD domain-containing protein n=1 Tax=Maribacter sp. 2307ULW6-5 TaxID=3386275 RepID=UPI0039BD492F
MKLYKICFLSLLLLASCNEDDDVDFGEKPEGGDFTIALDSINPLKIKLTPLNIDTTQVRLAWDFGIIEEGRTDRSIEYSPEVTYPDEGTYTITMTTYNDVGFTTKNKNVDLKFPPGPNVPPDFQILTGSIPGQGKAWIVDRFTDGHSSAGRTGDAGDITGFWSRPANNMACMGMYNDVYIFNFEEGKTQDNQFILATGGDVYTRNGFDTGFASSLNPADAGCNDVAEGETPPVLSGGDRLATYDAPSDLTYNLSTRADGTKIITLSPGGYLGMWVEPLEYEAIVFNENEIQLAFVQGGGEGAVRWGVRLVPLPEAATILTGGSLEGKTWVIDKDIDGHSTAGRVSTGLADDFWSRPAGAMECLGLYNDEYTFKLDGFAYDLETGGDVYTRNLFIDQYDSSEPSADICPAGTLSGGDFKADYVSPGGLTWSLAIREDDGVPLLRFSEGAYLGMDVDAAEYEILEITEESLYVRFVQQNGTGAVAWYKRLIPKN